MKIKLEVEIDTKQDMDEINQVIEIVSEFRDKLIALQEDNFDGIDEKTVRKDSLSMAAFKIL